MAQQSGDTSPVAHGAPIENDVRQLAERVTAGRKLFVVSNSGPLTFSESESGQLTASLSTGRISDVFQSIRDVPVTWVVGAVGSADRKASEALASGDDGSLRSDVLPVNWNVRFVAPPRRVNHKFYNVMCNPLLWFLFHRSWSPTFTPLIGSTEHDAWERGYRVVNEMFASEISVSAGDAPIVVISRDYQLMLVPGLVRSQHPEAAIHHSFDTPWPWPSDFEILPGEWRTQLLESLLAADVLSFPSARDISSFVACARECFGERIGRVDQDSEQPTIGLDGRAVRLSINPPAVRSAKFKDVAEFTPTRRFIDEFRDFGAGHTFVTVDRIEPHKNLVRPINAFGELLKRHPDLSDELRYVLILTPGPAHISAYKRLSEEIRRAARRVNEKYGSSRPVRVFEENNFYRAVAGLTMYDTLVSVPVVEGLGRAALDGPMVNSANGTMILSETNVASDYFGAQVARVGFADTSALADAMDAALAAPDEERLRKSIELRETVSSLSTEQSIKQVLGDLIDVKALL